MSTPAIKTLLTLVLVCAVHFAQAQIKLPFRQRGCLSTVADTGYYLKNAEAFLQKRLAERGLDPARTDFSSPYNVRVFIRIVRQNNGTLPGCTVETALQNFNEMQGQYNPHNICFQLAGIDFINDSYLNNFNIKDSFKTVYPAYIRSHNYDVDGAVTVFVHYNFMNNTGNSGISYGIPNNFLSVARWAADDATVHSIFGHEMGHCLGLYHTFEDFKGKESVTRKTTDSCYNCPTTGDLCCDTPADFESSGDFTDVSGNGCVYHQVVVDDCEGKFYFPSTFNIMSYQPWSCIASSGNAFTANQRTRMHATINDNSGPIYNRVAEDNLVLSTTSQTSNVVRIYTARNSVTMANGASISHTASSQAYYAAGSSVTFGPGVTFSPGGVGVVGVRISGCN